MSKSPTTDTSRLLARFSRTLQGGEVVFEAGQPATHAYLLEQGKVQLVRHSGGRERSVRVVRPGDLFGESALLPDSVRTTSAIAVGDGVALALDAEAVEAVSTAHPEVGQRIRQQLLERLREAETQVELLMLEDPRSKVVLALLSLERSDSHIGYRTAAGKVCFELSPIELAVWTGLDVASVKRVVQQLRRSDYVHITDERLEIPSAEALEALGQLLDLEQQVATGAWALR